MITVKLQVSERIHERIMWFLGHFSADELKRLLVEEYGINAGRITPVGKGEDATMSEVEARRARVIIIE